MASTPKLTKEFLDEPAGHSSSPCRPSSQGYSVPPQGHPRSQRSSAPDASCRLSERSYSINSQLHQRAEQENKILWFSPDEFSKFQDFQFETLYDAIAENSSFSEHGETT